MKLPIPHAALDMSAILLAKTRAGKSSTLRTIIEVLDKDGERNCIITPKDDWWGLKLGADGKSPGRPFVIFGGEYADVPINGRAGKDIGDLVATGNRPCIITLSELSIADRTRFMIDFAETLYKLNRGKIFLTVDECHNFAPKGKLFDPQQAAMLHWMNRLASEGLGRGIVLLSASQRPQKVHNDYLTSHELLVAKKVNHGADRSAIRDWAEGSGDKATVNKLVGSLAGLPRSDAWVWCPEIGLGPELVTFPFFQTYDSFKPQPVGGRTLKGWASVDLAEVEAKLSVVVEEAKSNDPKVLKARIAELERAAKSTKPAAVTVTPRNESAVLKDRDRAFQAGERQGYETGYTLGWQDGAPANFQAGVAAALKAAATVPVTTALQPLPKRIPALAQSAVVSRAVPHSTPLQSISPRASALVRHAAEGIVSPTARKILDCIHAAFPIGLTYPAAAARAAVSKRSSAYRKYQKEVEQSGEVEVDGIRFKSANGFAAPIASHGDPIETWASRLPPSYAKMFKSIARSSGGLGREDIAAEAGVSQTSSGLGSGLRELLALDLIVKDDEIYRLADALQ